MVYPNIFYIDSDKGSYKFKRFYMKYYNMMFAIAYEILRHKSDTEKAVDQGFYTIYKNLDKFQSLSYQEITPYVVIIIKEVSYRIYNSDKMKYERYRQVYKKISIDDDEVFNDISYVDILKMISDIPKIDYDIIVMHYILSFSEQEISRTLGLPLNKTMKRLEKSQIMLRTDKYIYD